MTSFTHVVPFAKEKHILERHVALKRPYRVYPIDYGDPILLGELNAWEFASDEAFESVEHTPLTKKELDHLVATSQPDERLLEGDEECPFD